MVNFQRELHREVGLEGISIMMLAAFIFLVGGMISGKILPKFLRTKIIESRNTYLASGNYTHSYGEIVYVRAASGGGHAFYHWKLNGQRLENSSPIIKVDISSNHFLRALFVKKDLLKPLKERSPPEGANMHFNMTLLDASECNANFFKVFSYVAVDINSSLNKGLLSNCSTGTENGQIGMTGLTMYGTRAEPLWLIENCKYSARKSLAVLEWVSFDGNGKVGLEVSPREVSMVNVS